MKKILFILIWVIIPVLILGNNSDVIIVETKNTAVVLSASPGEKVIYHHFGNKLKNYDAFKQRIFKPLHDTKNASFAPEFYPAYGGRSFLEPALQVIHADGVLTTELVYKEKEVKVMDDNVTETIIRMTDKLYPVEVEITFKTYYQEDVISQSVRIRNNQKGSIMLNNFYSSFLPLHKRAYFLTHFHGAWAAEMQMAEECLQPGIKKIESKKGVRTTQSENPSFLLSVNQPAGEDFGEVYAGSLAWSGNYTLSFELDESGILHILSGMNPFLSSYKLSKGESLTTPEMIWSYSDKGKGQISRNFHDWARKYALYHGDEIRPVVLNSWEGAYFKFDEKTIKDMIDDAASFGIEMFVLDDGWFGNKYPRNADNAGLGDWQVNKKKLPKGIHDLAEYTHKKGLKFGIWIEPEMVNPKSELAETHPDWIVKSGKREILTLRNQWLLDLTNPDVQDFVVKTFDETVALSPYISYIKWDANRHVENVGSNYLPAEKQTHFWIDYTKGLYKVYERIRRKHPDIMIQLCSSGGGRLDFGALAFHDEVWASDNTSPFSRVFIQYATNLFFPAIATGSHVSTSPNHQTGLITPLKFRFDVAMSGRLGMELQPKDIVGEDRIFAENAIQNYKAIRHIVQFGDLYRIISPYEEGGWTSLMYVSKDKKESVLFAYSLESHERTKFLKVQLNGLDPNKNYKIVELNMQKHPLSNANDKIYSGEYLMEVGIRLDINRIYSSAVLHIKEVENEI